MFAANVSTCCIEHSGKQAQGVKNLFACYGLVVTLAVFKAFLSLQWFKYAVSHHIPGHALITFETFETDAACIREWFY